MRDAGSSDERETQNCGRQIEVVAWAVPFAPSHEPEHLTGFEDVGHDDDEQAAGTGYLKPQGSGTAPSKRRQRPGKQPENRNENDKRSDQHYGLRLASA